MNLGCPIDQHGTWPIPIRYSTVVQIMPTNDTHLQSIASAGVGVVLLELLNLVEWDPGLKLEAVLQPLQITLLVTTQNLQTINRSRHICLQRFSAFQHFRHARFRHPAEHPFQPDVTWCLVFSWQFAVYFRGLNKGHFYGKANKWSIDKRKLLFLLLFRWMSLQHQRVNHYCLHCSELFTKHPSLNWNNCIIWLLIQLRQLRFGNITLIYIHFMNIGNGESFSR